jgi:antitoxin ParD1/3/4
MAVRIRLYFKGGQAMTTMNISLPAAMREFVEKRVSEEGYSSASEYIRALVRDEQKRKAKARLEALILEGTNSGESTLMTAQDWEDIRREVRERRAKRKKR